jgi:hypothetical protein
MIELTINESNDVRVKLIINHGGGGLVQEGNDNNEAASAA